MIKSNSYIILIIIVIAFVLSSCVTDSSNNKEELITVSDMLGREVEIPAEINRIIGLRAGALRLLTYMDAADLVVGIEQGEKKDLRPYTAAFPELLDVQSIGPNMGGDAELIISASPDVIFITYTTVEEADHLQNKTGIPVIALECTDIGTEADVLFQSFQLIGQVLNKENRADSLINYISNMINELDARTSDVHIASKPSVYVGGLSYSNSYGISATHPDYSSFMFVNAKNVVSEVDRRFSSHVKGTFIDIEQILLWNPNIIFIDEAGLAISRDEIKSNKLLFGELEAVRDNKIYVFLRYNNYATNYEYVLINSWYAGKVIYPDIFSDIEIETKAEEILSVFFGKDIKLLDMPTEFALKQFKSNK